MSWRTVVVTGTAKLEYKLDYLVIRKKDSVSRVHLSEIGMLIVESTMVSMTSVILCELVKRKVKVIFCDEHHDPISELTPYYGSHNTSLKVREQSIWGDDIKARLWQRIIRDKIAKQARFLGELKKENEKTLLESYIDEVQPADLTNREGHAAKVYFNALFTNSFTRGGDDPINSALDYGYDLILSAFNREIVSQGYITQLGIWHDNQFNQYNLSSDLMETFRILVDRRVCEMMPQKLDRSEKLDLLSVLNDHVLIDGREQVVQKAIEIYCRSAFDALNNNDPALLKTYSNEL